MSGGDAHGEVFVLVVNTGSDVECGAVNVAGGDTLVRALVVVIVIGNEYFRAFECLVVEAGLDSDGPFAAPFFEFEGELCADVERLV